MTLRTQNREYIHDLLSKGTREHARGPMDYRNINLEINRIPHAEGSALVDLGDTKVLVGVKLDVGEPMRDKPDQGALTTSAELLPIASAEYEAGPPNAEAIEFARVVDRGIRAAELVDADALFIEKGKVWQVYVDIYVLNYDGNLFDAGTLAATSALLTARMPKYENEEVIREGNLGKLPTKGIATSCTFAKVDKHLVLDPNANEEAIMNSRLTIANDEKYIRAMQKGLGGSLTYNEMEKAIDATFEKSKYLRDIIKKGTGE